MELEVGSAAEQLKFIGYPNEGGFLGRLETTVAAESFGDAATRAYDAVAPQLSVWSAQLDIPLLIWRTHVTETMTGSMNISINSPFQEGQPLGDEAVMTAEFSNFASFYREALESKQ